MPKKFYLKNYGCQMNEYDAELLSGLLKKEGYFPVSSPREADLILLNTCYVREKVKHKVMSYLGEVKKLKRKNPFLLIGVAGCLAQKEKENLLEKVPEVDFVLGPMEIHRIGEVVRETEENHTRLCVTEEREIPEGLPINRRKGVSTFVPIIRGCNNFCSYCNVPYVRGREKSRSPEVIFKEIEAIAREGYKEITLLGQNVNSYGKDRERGIDFADLLELVSQVEGIERIRFTTSHPKDLTLKLLQKIAELPKVCEWLHLPLQSGSNKILKLMNRKYTREHYRELVEKAREKIPGVSITTDIIVGFPGEDEKDFEDTLELLQELRLEGAFTFVYSPLWGTEAASFPSQIPEKVKKERLRRLILCQQKITEENNRKLLGKEVELLVEGRAEKTPHFLQGRTRTNKVVLFEGREEFIGKLVWVKIKEAGCWHLMGELTG